MLITPQQTITLVLQRKAKDATFRPYETKPQQCSFYASIYSFGVGVVAGLAFRLLSGNWLAWISLGCLLVSAIAAAAYQVAQIVPELRKLRNIEADVSAPLVAAFNDDMDLIQNLATFDPHHLSYAKAMFLGMAKHIRERCGLLVGAIDKVGLLPIAATSCFSYAKALRDGLTFGPIEWVTYAFIALFLFAVRLISTAQWMENVAELYAHAISIQARRGEA